MIVKVTDPEARRYQPFINGIKLTGCIEVDTVAGTAIVDAGSIMGNPALVALQDTSVKIPSIYDGYRRPQVVLKGEVTLMFQNQFGEWIKVDG